MQTQSPTNRDDIIDSRDVIQRIELLEGLNEASDPDENDVEELKALKALVEEASGCTDWEFGETLIRDSYFATYAQELAEDCGMRDKGGQWPYTCIDWEQAAKELQYDYTAVDFDGVTYWIRS